MNAKFDLIDKICSPKWSTVRKAIYILFEIVSLAAIFWLIFCPICTIQVQTDTVYAITPISVFAGMDSELMTVISFIPMQLAVLGALTLMMLIVAFKLIQTLFSLAREEEISRYANTAVLISVATVIVYTLFAFVFSPVNLVLGGKSASDVAYGPLILVGVIVILYATVNGIVTAYNNRKEDSGTAFDIKMKKERKKQRRMLLLKQLELLGFAAGVSAISLLSLLTEIVKVTFAAPGLQIPDLIISGKKLLFHTDELTLAGERTLAYFIFVMFFLTCISLFLALVAFCSRSTVFGRVAMTATVTGASSCLLVGLFGQYYKVVQTLNAEIVVDLLQRYHIEAEELLQYKISSQSLIYFYIVLAFLTLLFIRRPYSKAKELERSLYAFNTTVLASSPNVHISGGGAAVGGASVSGGSASDKGEHDPCPAFSALDDKERSYRDALARAQSVLFEDPTLPNLVSFIVAYAANSDQHLSYTRESIATFLAGLGTTRLTILQGMSGTGKTSLPKIVAEALCSVCDIVEVESSWRDKNELLGYYNEFSKVYTPKKFTQALYRARLNPEIITFIVLDEMNLSRIEYYFSDFLSLMENRPDQRYIKLLNTPIARRRNDDLLDYKGLVDGTTLEIPQNIWFIGTANRDESTYDISDKVYDRAHTMNFDKRAPKLTAYGEPIPARYLPAPTLVKLLAEAQQTVNFSLSQFADLPKAEALLQPYNISFGSRVERQIESFVSIYAACFPMETEQAKQKALDAILLSKVVKKLEMKSVDDKVRLANEFAKIGLTECSSFIKSLKED